MSNPVFNRIDKESRQGVGGFGHGQASFPQQGYGQPGYYATPSADQLGQMYNAPSAGPVQMGRVTLDDVMMKTLTLFGVLLITTVISWFTMGSAPAMGALLWMVGMLGGLVLGLVIAFSKTIRPALILAYAALEGLFVGGASAAFEHRYPGVVATAVVATLCVFAAMFAGWRAGFIKVTAKTRRIVGLLVMGYLFFSLVNFVASLVMGGWGFLHYGSGMGILISLFVVGLASYTLAEDFDSIDQAVRAGMPEKYSWLLAHGLMVSVVWLYLEILRLVGQLRE